MSLASTPECLSKTPPPTPTHPTHAPPPFQDGPRQHRAEMCPSVPGGEAVATTQTPRLGTKKKKKKKEDSEEEEEGSNVVV